MLSTSVLQCLNNPPDVSLSTPFMYFKSLRFQYFLNVFNSISDSRGRLGSSPASLHSELFRSNIATCDSSDETPAAVCEAFHTQLPLAEISHPESRLKCNPSPCQESFGWAVDQPSARFLFQYNAHSTQQTEHMGIRRLSLLNDGKH